MQAYRWTLVLLLGVTVSSVRANELWTVSDGTVEINVNLDRLEALGLRLGPLSQGQAGRNGEVSLSLHLDRLSDLSFAVEFGAVTEVYAAEVLTVEDLQLVGRSGKVAVRSLLLGEGDVYVPAGLGSAARGDAGPALQMDAVRAGFHSVQQTLTMPAQSLRITREAAAALGDESLTGAHIGWAVVNGQADWVGGTRPVPVAEVGQPSLQEGGTANFNGGDMTFCQLYGLSQFGRSGSVVGLALATTSWNIGTADLHWFQSPDSRHPVIAMNMYRLKDDRFEQIGQSWLKHGFFALASTQCATPCTHEPGHGAGNWLGMGCTDTYSSSLNASQSNLGPRHEVNPWTGAWQFAGSHFNSGSHSHSPVAHRLQVHDNDLSPALNSGATYFAEGYYVVFDDHEPMNNAAWKPVTVSGSPGSTWSFGMTGSLTSPNIGFALDAWTGARQTVLAEMIPPVKERAPDGRCILAAKDTKIGDNLWQYEYALLNVDMDRKGGSFTIPLAPGTTVSNVGFHAVLSHDEPYSNTPWSVNVTGSEITWSTSDNPLRWGTLYNFRFEADAPPADTTVVLGLYEPGTPTSVSGITTGPSPAAPECEVLAAPQAQVPNVGKNRYISLMPSHGGSEAALRVRLVSLLGPVEQSVAQGGPDFSAFEGETRWVGPPQLFSDGPGGATFLASALQCEPYFQDWNDVGVLHVYGAEILPESQFDVQLVHETCASGLDVESNYSDPLVVTTNIWGDIVPPYHGEPESSVQPDIEDIAAVVAKFGNTPTAPAKVRAQLQPNIPDPSALIDINDIVVVVGAFQGTDYSYPGPSTCP